MKCYWLQADEAQLADAAWKKEISSNSLGTQSLNALNDVLYSDEMQASVGDITDLKFFQTEIGIFAAAVTTQTEIVLRRYCAGSNVALYIGVGAVGAGLGLLTGHLVKPLGKLGGATIGVGAGLIGAYLLKNYLHGSMAGLGTQKISYAGRR